MFHTIAVLALLLQQGQVPTPAQTPPTVARITVTPSSPTVVSGDSLRLRAEALDARGNRLADVPLRFVAVAGGEQGHVDSTGLVVAGAFV